MTQTTQTNTQITVNEREQFGEYQAIEKALAPYIEAAQSGKSGDLNKAFLPHARIVGSADGNYSELTVKEFEDFVQSNPGSPNIQYHIAWIEVSGPAAAVRVEFIDWLGFRFTDFFVLFKKDGQWKISGKVYDSHSRN